MKGYNPSTVTHYQSESISIDLQGLKTGKALWDALCEKHEKKALTVVVDLWHRLYVLKCLDDSNVKTHIQSLNAMYQQLKGMGEVITETDFKTLILDSLPKSYRPLINTISLQNCANPTAVKPAIVMESILEEFDRLQIKDSQSKTAENAMMATGIKGKGKKKKSPMHPSGNLTNPDIDCWNRGEK